MIYGERYLRVKPQKEFRKRWRIQSTYSVFDEWVSSKVGSKTADTNKELMREFIRTIENATLMNSVKIKRESIWEKTAESK